MVEQRNAKGRQVKLIQIEMKVVERIGMEFI